MRIRFLMLIAAAGLVPFAAAAQSSSSSAPAEEVRHRPDVIVTGNRAEFRTRITGFVNQLTDFNFGDSGLGLARWQDPICPLVTGLPRDMAEYILQRVSEIAQTVGAPLAGEKCRYQNLFIIVTKHPETYLRDLEKRHGSTVFGAAAPILIDEFIATPRPVRTWYDTVEQTPEGLPMLTESFPGISQQYAKPVAGGVEIVPVRPAVSDASLANPWSQASHLVNNVVWAIKRVYVVVDPTRFKGVKLGQLTDYVVMSGLAQIKLDPRVADDPTILSLFDRGPEASSAGLTDWDQAFLKSFYATEQKSVLQRSAIAEDMIEAIVP